MDKKTLKAYAKRIRSGARLDFCETEVSRGMGASRETGGKGFYIYGYGEDRYGQVARKDTGSKYYKSFDEFVEKLGLALEAYGLKGNNTGRVSFLYDR